MTGRYWGQEEKRTTEDEMAGWHHWFDGCEFEWTPGVGDGQGGCVLWFTGSQRVRHDWVTELNWTGSQSLQAALGVFYPYGWPIFPAQNPYVTTLELGIGTCFSMSDTLLQWTMEGGGSPCSSQIAFPGVEPLSYVWARLGAIRALVVSACLVQVRVGAGWRKRDQVFLAMPAWTWSWERWKIPAAFPSGVKS